MFGLLFFFPHWGPFLFFFFLLGGVGAFFSFFFVFWGVVGGLFLCFFFFFFFLCFFLFLFFFSFHPGDRQGCYEVSFTRATACICIVKGGEVAFVLIVFSYSLLQHRQLASSPHPLFRCVRQKYEATVSLKADGGE